jgi:predicted acylesterase/phospholipase RssA
MRLLGEERRCYDLYAGVSVGALVAAHLAQYKAGEEAQAAADLHTLFTPIEDRHIYHAWRPFGVFEVPWQPSIFTASPLRRLIKKSLDTTRVQTSGKKLRIGATSLNTGCFRLFDETFSDLHAAVYASAAYPVAFEPGELLGEWWTDGGVRSVTPIEAAIRAGATHIDVVLCAPEKSEHAVYRSEPRALTTTLRTLDLMSDQIISDDVKKAQLYNRLVEAGAEMFKRKIEMCVIRPERVLNDNSLRFEPLEAVRLQKLGYEDARRR